MLQNFITMSLTGAPNRGPATNPFMQWLPIIAVFFVFYLFFIRPQIKKQKDQEDMRTNLAKGDKVVTIGGIIGTIVNIKENGKVVTLSVNDTTRMDFTVTAINSKIVATKEK